MVRPVAGQLRALPVMVSPRGGPGWSLAADYGRGINDDSRKNTTVAARVSYGISALTIGVGGGVVNPFVSPDEREARFQYMGLAAVRILGGPSEPVSINFQGGAGFVSFEFTTAAGTVQDVSVTEVPLGVGIGFELPRPSFWTELWVAPRVSIHSVGLDGDRNAQSGFGFSTGFNMGFNSGLGFHAALDWTHLSANRSGTPDLDEADPATFGIGVDFRF